MGTQNNFFSLEINTRNHFTVFPIEKKRESKAYYDFRTMAFSSKLPLVLFISSLFVHVALAGIVCENLPKGFCSFSISSSGKRCLLETSVSDAGNVKYQCRTSEVMVARMSEYIENDRCVKACGVDRNSVGISSDALLEPTFTTKLCSPPCYQKCPNIVDLYFNLAAGEGVFLPDLCEKKRGSPHREMFELLSSGASHAPAPATGGTPASTAASGPDAMGTLSDSGSADAPAPSSM